MAFSYSFAGCSEKEITPPVSIIISDTVVVIRDTINTSPGGYTYLALGDSYTIGQNVPEEARFPVQAAAQLTTKGIKVNNPVIIARTGWTTTDLLNAIAISNLNTNYDIVSLLIGVNDQYQRKDTVGYREKFTQCLEKAIQLANGNKNHVFVLSIPDYSVTPFGQAMSPSFIATQIDQFNAINRSVTFEQEISYTDVTHTSRAVKNDPEMIASDGLHPGGQQYTLWAKLLVADILKKFP